MSTNNNQPNTTVVMVDEINDISKRAISLGRIADRLGPGVHVLIVTVTDTHWNVSVMHEERDYSFWRNTP